MCLHQFMVLRQKEGNEGQERQNEKLHPTP